MNKEESGYQDLLKEVEHQLSVGRIAAVKAVNQEMIIRYWEIGKCIVERQAMYGWGKSVVERLARDLQLRAPSLHGFSSRNLWDMRRLYERYKDNPNLRQLVAEVPWGHNLLILNKTKDLNESIFYLKKTAESGWSRNVLTFFMEADDYKASLKSGKQNNFKATLPEDLADQAEEAIKSSYSLEFLGLSELVKEHRIQNKMIEQIRDIILSLGYGFSYIGHRHKIRLGDNLYYIDLLFYHRHLQCMVAMELKAGKFEPAHAMQLNFYLEILDRDKLAHENPSIGMLLCTKKDELEVEYALRVTKKPIGVAEYRLTKELPDGLNKALPDPEELRTMLSNLAPDLQS